jgi:hypothetical protein
MIQFRIRAILTQGQAGGGTLSHAQSAGNIVVEVSARHESASGGVGWQRTLEEVHDYIQLGASEDRGAV